MDKAIEEFLDGERDSPFDRDRGAREAGGAPETAGSAPDRSSEIEAYLDGERETLFEPGGRSAREAGGAPETGGADRDSEVEAYLDGERDSLFDQGQSPREAAPVSGGDGGGSTAGNVAKSVARGAADTAFSAAGGAMQMTGALAEGAAEAGRDVARAFLGDPLSPLKGPEDRDALNRDLDELAGLLPGDAGDLRERVAVEPGAYPRAMTGEAFRALPDAQRKRAYELWSKWAEPFRRARQGQSERFAGELASNRLIQAGEVVEREQPLGLGFADLDKEDFEEAYGVPREFAESTLGQVSEMGGQLAVFVPAAMTGAGAPVMGGALWTEATRDYYAARGIEPGEATPEQRKEAFGYAAIYTPVATAIERGLGIEGLARRLAKRGVRDRGLVREAVAAFASAAGGEGAEEALQGGTLDALASLTYDRARGVLDEDGLKRRLAEFGYGALLGGVAGGAMGGAAAADAALARRRTRAERRPEAEPEARPEAEPEARPDREPSMLEKRLDALDAEIGQLEAKGGDMLDGLTDAEYNRLKWARDMREETRQGLRDEGVEPRPAPESRAAAEPAPAPSDEDVRSVVERDLSEQGAEAVRRALEQRDADAAAREDAEDASLAPSERKAQAAERRALVRQVSDRPRWRWSEREVDRLSRLGYVQAKREGMRREQRRQSEREMGEERLRARLEALEDTPYGGMEAADLEFLADRGDEGAVDELVRREDAQAGSAERDPNDEIARVLKRLGGLPDPAAMRKAGKEDLIGELEQLQEATVKETTVARKGGRGKEAKQTKRRIQPKGLWAKGQTGSLDQMAEALRADHGFSWIRTPADLIETLDQRFRDGEEIYPDWSDAENVPGVNFSRRRAASGARRDIPEIGEAEAVANLDWLDAAEPVASMRGDEMPATRKVRELVEAAASVWRQKAPSGGVAHPLLGRIGLNRRSAKNSMSHGIGPRAKRQALYLLPDAVPRSRLLGKLEKADANRPDAWLLAAPVRAGEETHELLSVVRGDPSTRSLYLHEVRLRGEKDAPADALRTAAASPRTEAEPHGAPEGAIDSLLRDLREKQARKRGDGESGAEDAGFRVSRRAVRSSARGGVGVPKIVAQREVEDLREAWSDRGVAIRVAQDERELPERYRRMLIGDPGAVEGFFDPASGETWLIADNLASAARAREVLFHEILGHRGMHEVLGDRYESFMESVYRRVQDTPEAARIADDYGLDLGQAEDRRELAEEYVARLAEGGVEDAALWRRVLRAVRDWLRSMGWGGEISETDIRLALIEARRRLERGPARQARPRPAVAAEPARASRPGTPGETGEPGKIDFSALVRERMGDEALREVQPQVSLEDKRQLLFDFSESVSDEALFGRLDADSGAGDRGGEPALPRGLRVVGRQLREGLREDLKIDFIGAEIGEAKGSSPRAEEKLVGLAQTLRNPKFETMYYIGVREGRVVGSYAVTARIPFTAPVVEGYSQSIGAAYDAVMPMLRASGADGYYMLHNHPSGDPSPSKADMKVTPEIARGFEDIARERDEPAPPLRAHIVIDHYKYSLIDRDGNLWQRNRSIKGRASRDTVREGEAALPNPALRTEINSSAEVVNAGIALRDAKEQGEPSVTVFAVDNRHVVLGVLEGGMEDLQARPVKEIRDMARDMGAARFFAAARARDAAQMDEYIRLGAELRETGKLDELVAYSFDANNRLEMRSLSAQEGTWSTKHYFGQRKIGGDRVQEPSAAYREAGRDRDHRAAVERGDMEAAQKLVDEAARAAGYDFAASHGSHRDDIEAFDPGRAGEVLPSDWARAGTYFAPGHANGAAESYRVDAVIENDAEDARLWEAYEQKARELGTTPMMAGIDLGRDSRAYEELKEFERRWRAHRNEMRDDPQGGRVYDVFLKVDDPLVYPAVGIADPWLAEQAAGRGHDAVVIISDGDQATDWRQAAQEVVVWQPEQIKSADPATYDADGRLTPLSQRFDPADERIRFSRRRGGGAADAPLSASRDVKGLRADKDAWAAAGYPDEGARDLVDRYYRADAYAALPEDAVLVPVPSTSGRNVLPGFLAERIAADRGLDYTRAEIGHAEAAKEAKKKSSFWAKMEDPVGYAPGPALEKLKALGRPVAIVEDVHNTGESWMAFADMLAREGVEVVDVAALASADARRTSDRDIERIGEKLAAQTEVPLDEARGLMETLFRGSYKQFFNKAERAVTGNARGARRLVALARERADTAEERIPRPLHPALFGKRSGTPRGEAARSGRRLRFSKRRFRADLDRMRGEAGRLTEEIEAAKAEGREPSKETLGRRAELRGEIADRMAEARESVPQLDADGNPAAATEASGAAREAEQPRRNRANADLETATHAKESDAAMVFRQLRQVFQGFKSSLPELPNFGKWNDKPVQFFTKFREGYRRIVAATGQVQKQAEEDVHHVLEPLIALGRERIDAGTVERWRRLTRRRKKLREQGKDVPERIPREIAQLEEKLADNPYYLFQSAVLYRDLWYRSLMTNKDGKPLKLPGGIAAEDVRRRLGELHGLIAGHENADAIGAALKRHYALVETLQQELLAHGQIIPEDLRNPLYFPHHVLENFTGKIGSVQPVTEPAFRSYLLDPVGSAKEIEADYLKGIYHHVAQVRAHNAQQDLVEQYWQGYDASARVQAEIEQEAAEEGRPTHPDQWKNPKHWPAGYTLYTVEDQLPLRMEYVVDRDTLAKELGVALGDGDLRKRMAEQGVELDLTPEMLQSALTAGDKRQWLLPEPVAEALQGLKKRQQSKRAQKAVSPGGISRVFMKGWKYRILFAPWNYLRYEFNNSLADIEKTIALEPSLFAEMPGAARELRAFWRGESEGSKELKEAFKRGVVDSVTVQEADQLKRFEQFTEFLTSGQATREKLRRWATATTDIARLREGTVRYAKFKADVRRLRGGAAPVYGGAYWKDVDARDGIYAKASYISQRTFGDYSDLSVTGQWLREHMVPFYSWMEINARYHANLFRNTADMLRAGRWGDAKTAGQMHARAGAATAAGMLARLAMPYLMIQMWNAFGGAMMGLWDEDEDLEAQLSEHDRRRLHIILGKDAEGNVKLVHTPTAFSDIMEWFGGNRAVSLFTDYAAGRITLEQAFSDYGKEVGPQVLNKAVQSVRPDLKAGYMATARKDPFPDIMDQRTISKDDLPWAIFRNLTDYTVGLAVRNLLDDEYYSNKSFPEWAQQAFLQVRRRDPEQWAYYEIRESTDQWLEENKGEQRAFSYDAPDQQAIRNFRKAIYNADVSAAIRFYNVLLGYGYTADRFKRSIYGQDPLSGLSKEDRRKWYAQLSDHKKKQVEAGMRYYARIAASKGSEERLFPTERQAESGRFFHPRVGELAKLMRESMLQSDQERERFAEELLERSLD